MTEVRLNILKSKEVKDFEKNRPKWLRKRIKELEEEFQKDYNLDNITLGVSVSLGTTSDITGSLTVTLSPKKDLDIPS